MASKILVLDDEESYTRMLRDLLEQNRYYVVAETVPGKALELLKEEEFDLVVSDYKMPVMDGAAFLKKARELYPDLPVILVSGLMNTPELVKVANMSVTLVFEKPLNTRDFLDNVRRFADPMTDEEEAAQGEAIQDVVAASGKEDPDLEASYSFPNTRFFSAACLSSRRVLQKLWTAVHAGSLCALTQSEGGDAELLVREVCGWRVSKPDAYPFFANLDTILSADNEAKLETLLEPVGFEKVLGLRVDIDINADDFEHKIQLLDERFRAVPGGDPFYPLFIFTGGRGEYGGVGVPVLADFQDFEIISVPPLVVRAPDAAAYILEILGSNAEGGTAPLTLSIEAAYALISYEWPGNLSELRSAMRMIASKSEGEIKVDTVLEVLGEQLEFSMTTATASRGERLSWYLRMRQRIFLRTVLDGTDLSPAAIASALGIEREFGENEEALLNAPLIHADFGKLR